MNGFDFAFNNETNKNIPPEKLKLTENNSLWIKTHKTLSYALCGALLFIAFITLFIPIIIATDYFSITPAQLMSSLTIEDLSFGREKALIFSYYVFKIFFIAFGAVLGISFLLAVFCIVTKKKYTQRCINYIMAVMTLLIFIAMLTGLSYANTYNMLNQKLSISVPTGSLFVIACIILALKFVCDIVFGRINLKESFKEDLRTSHLSVAMSFVLLALVAAAFFTPVYTVRQVTSGTSKLTGFGILIGREDVLSHWLMSGFIKTALMFFAVVTVFSFTVNLVLYITSRKAFVYYNKFNNFLGFSALVTYSLIGASYICTYLDGLYGSRLILSISTFSYIPLVLYLLFLLGFALTKLTASRTTVEYNIITKQSGLSEPVTLSVSGGGGGGDKTNDDLVSDPIPAFSELDRQAAEYNKSFASRAEHGFDELTLPHLVSHIIEYARHSPERLSYSYTDIKCFVAGLAAGKLTILQGMSGTGKTSLPGIFMEAIDGICEIIAVESSWRDKNELLGYYNEFNKKYTPKSFTQFLYKASLNQKVPFFIVLDELNLSRIEYYFSDFLSLMEFREDERFIKLFDVQLYPSVDERTNYLALRDGHTIKISKNVWFIGTANRDESTFEISDKVYDRAQTMNFDKRAPKVYVEDSKQYPKKFVSYPAIRKLFAEALKSVEFDAELYDAIHKAEYLLRPYKISFGNRIVKQMEDFVKVYAACGNPKNSIELKLNIHEAVDCFLCSKVVRKLEFRQIQELDDLIDEFTALEFPICSEFLRRLQNGTEQ